MNNKIKSIIKEFANTQNINKIGFTESKNAGKGSNDYKSAIVALFPYYVKNETGTISMYARGKDYHSVIREKLKPVSILLKENGAKFADIYGDTGGFDDRRAAVYAGLGFVGKNGMVISDEYGSYAFIGMILTDMEFEYDKPDLRRCLECGMCEKNCIGGAIASNGKFNIENCVSHISQKKGELAECEEELILKSGMCWGCDRCQEVCPYNAELEDTALDEFRYNRIMSFSADELTNISNREFMRKYRNYAFSWRGKNPILRNLNILDKCGLE